MTTSTQYESIFSKYNEVYDNNNNINEKLSRSRLIKYKYRVEIWEESTMRMVYDFCKKDLKDFKERPV